MNGIEITDVFISHRSGATLVEQRNDNTTASQLDVQFLTGYFTAMVNTLTIYQKCNLIRRVAEIIELWASNEACICVFISEFYTIIAFVRLTDRAKPTRDLMTNKVLQIKQKFDEKYKKILLGWNQNLQVFKGFEKEIKSIIEN